MDISPCAEYWIWFTSCFGMNKRIWDIVPLFSSVRDAYHSLQDGTTAEKLLSPEEIKHIRSTDIVHAKAIVDYCNEKNIGILCYDDNEYPLTLKSVYNPPCHLFYRGDISCINNQLILAVVGTRNPSDYSIAVTKALVKQLLQYDIVVASGFAKGIDITAHSACFENGGKTIAVLGCGLEINYPAENYQYRKQIEQNGVFISEYYPGSKPTSYSFPQRNRILSGISNGTVVIEAGEKSGSLITANLALSQGKDIFCIPPHNIFDKRYRGNISLLRDGAISVFSKQDILYEYFENYSHKLTETLHSVSNLIAKDSIESTAMPAERKSNQEKAERDYSSLSEQEMAVVNALKNAENPLIADEISQIINMEISDTLMLLTDLELEEIVEIQNGQCYILK